MAHSKRIKSNTVAMITMLWIFFALLTTDVAHAAWNHKNVMGVSECSECHEDEVKVWKKTAHQKNYKSLSRNKDAKIIADKMGVKKIKKDTAMCSSCHYTIGHKNGKAKIVAGVSCESCHSPAKGWINIHNDYGGKGVNKKSESTSHKQTRYKKLEDLDMIRPDNTYGWAKNCLNCHIVADEKLVNTGGHKAGSDFKLSKRTQGKIRHYPEANVDTLRYYNLVSFSTELELSLIALSNAKGGKYASEMQKRATSSLAKLKKANDTTPDKHAKKIISLANKASIKAGNKQLGNVAKSISVNIMQMVQQKTGYAYDSRKLKHTPQQLAKKVKPAPIAKKKTVRKIPAEKKVISQTKTTTKAKVTSGTRPEPKKLPKQIIKTTAIPTPKPTQELTTANPVDEVSVTKIQSTELNDQLLEEFNVVVPGNFALCQTYSPWALGKQKLKHNTGITQDGCFGINIKAGRTAQLYLFSESINNSLIRLVPNNCDYLGISFNALSAHKVAVIPKPGHSSSAIKLNELPGYNKLYAVIADSAYANGEMSRLSTNTSSICDFNKPTTEKNNNHQALGKMLDAIKVSADGHLDWRMQRLQ